MKKIVAFLVALLALARVAAATTPVAQIPYQGYITESGAQVNGTRNFVFQLFGQPTGGTSLWQESATLTVNNGVFSTYLGLTTALPDTIYSGQTIWLQTEVDSNVLPTRQAIVPGVLALHAIHADTASFAVGGGGGSESLWQTDGTNVWRPSGNVGVGINSPAYKLDIHTADALQGLNWEVDTGTEAGAYARFSSNNGRGALLLGNPSPHGTEPADDAWLLHTTGGWGWNKQLNISGNVGIGTTSPGANIDLGSARLEVRAPNTSFGPALAIRADAGGRGIRLVTQDFNNNTNVGTQLSIDTGSMQVYTNGVAGRGNLLLQSDGGNVGIGAINPTAKLDVLGNALIQGNLTTTGTISGNFAGTISNADLLDGVDSGQFLRNDQSGVFNGKLTVNGPGGASHAADILTSSSSACLFVENTGNATGVYARSAATSSTDGAVSGLATTDGGSGVYGQTSSLGKPGGSSVGVFGFAPSSGQSIGGAALGVLGEVHSSQGSGASVPCGVFGWGTATSGINAGVWGETKSAQGFGVYSAGNMAVDGNIYYNGSLIHTTGSTGATAITSPESWVEDFGQSQLVNGTAHVDLDPRFMATVSIDDISPMKVFVGLNGDCAGVYVKKGKTGFDVFELSGGTSNVAFDYRIVAKLKGQEKSRFVEVPRLEISESRYSDHTATHKK